MRTNLLLVAAVIVLGLAIRFVPGPVEESGFTIIDPARLSEIRVIRNGDTHFALARDGEAWRVVEPFALPADDFQVSALLASLGEPASRRYPVEEANLAELGLENPEWIVQAGDVALQLGGHTAIGNQRYVRAGESVYLVNDVLGFRLKRPALDYASRRVLPRQRKIAAIELPSGTRIERADAGWSLAPEDAGIGADTLQRLIDAWRLASAMDVTFANSVPRNGQVLVEFADGSELRFGVELADERLRLTRDRPAVTYTLPADKAAELLQLVPADAGTPAE